MNLFRKPAGAIFALALVVVSISGCVNLFDPIDNPSGDRQLLSAARAAFDKGDIAKAREYYEKLGADDVAQSELVFMNLDSCGAGIDAIGVALSKGTDSVNSPGILLTIMGEKMNPLHSAGCFASLLSSYKTARSITDKNLRGFTTFLTGLAIAGEVLANNTGITTDGELAITDYVGSTPCTVASCAVGCAKTDGITAAAAVDLSLATTITATWGTLQGAVNGMSNALINELQIANSGSAYTLISALGTATSSSNFLYRCALHDIGVGR